MLYVIFRFSDTCFDFYHSQSRIILEMKRKNLFTMLPMRAGPISGWVISFDPPHFRQKRLILKEVQLSKTFPSLIKMGSVLSCSTDGTLYPFGSRRRRISLLALDLTVDPWTLTGLAIAHPGQWCLLII